MHKYSVAYPDNAIIFRTKNKWAIRPWKDMELPYMNITKRKKPIFHFI